ncbi:hypothetical protein [Aneurinibacillus soli]|uniref:Uncharacterized protein n=1 Tax=Aneurinibacillus soli TaxID=1500254 RepID=A0A0U5B5C1_9BACL|nr:hypothetical protein CB4_01055 [Aneurinibacillus soli]
MSMCPICNGFSHLDAHCPSCGHRMEDAGKLEALYGPYSPYNEWGDVSMTNGYLDQLHHECMHISSCPHCGLQKTMAVPEMHSSHL